MTPRPLRLALLLPAVSLFIWLAAPAAAQTDQDDLLPAGAWRLRTALAQERQSEVYNRKDKRGTLKTYVIPRDSVRAQLTGDLTRIVQRAELEFQFGLGDRWNVSVGVPFVHVAQDSSLEPIAGADQEAQETAERFGSRTVSGLGDFRITSLHRTKYTDRFSWVLGYGVWVPAGNPKSDYDGVGTLDVRSPTAGGFALAHFTFFPESLARHRLDLQWQVGRGFETVVNTVQDGRQLLVPGTTTLSAIGWRGEFGTFLAGFQMAHETQTSNSLGGTLQRDNSTETLVRLTLGFGNMTELEAAPIARPYEVLLTAERSLQGFNRILSSEVSLLLQTFF